MPAFWDASAVVPLCFPQSLTGISDRIVVWWGTPVEVRAAVFRLAADSARRHQEAQVALARLAMLRQSWREVLPTERLRSSAENLAGSKSLRAGDLLQLAAALDWCDHRPQQRPFICFDRRLAEAAGQLGFAVYQEF